MTDLKTRPVVYLDANPFIYFVEGAEDIAAPVRSLFALLETRPDLGVTSELTLAEVLPKAQTADKTTYFDLILWKRLLQLIPVSRSVLVAPAEYRRERSMQGGRMPKLPDAIHVVTAARSGCRYFVSNDARLPVPNGIRKIVPDAASVSTLLKDLA